MARRWLRIRARIAWQETIGAIERSAATEVDEARAEEAEGRAAAGQGKLAVWLYSRLRGRKWRRR